MKKLLRFLFTFLFVISAFYCFGYFFWYKPKFKPGNYSASYKISSKIYERLKSKADVLKAWSVSRRYNSTICFLADLSIASGKNRFFVYDLSIDSVLKEGLVAHGSCDAGFQVSPAFSNKVNSGCSAMGKYKIGASYQGGFGLAYKLYGLDSSNSNAFERNIVSHAYACVPEQETEPVPVCNSRGCPMVSPGFLTQLKPIIDNSKKPIILWIYQ